MSKRNVSTRKKSKIPSSLEALKTAIKTLNKNMVLEEIHQTNTSSILMINDLAFKLFEIFPEPRYQKKLFATLLNKVNIEIGKGTSKTPELLYKLKAESQFYHSIAGIALIEQNASEDYKFHIYKLALPPIEEAHAISQKNAAKSIHLENLTVTIQNYVMDMLSSYTHSSYAFELAKISITLRTENLKTSPTFNESISILSALQIGAIIGELTFNEENTKQSKETQIEALQFAETAFNLAIDLNQKDSAATALRCIAEIYCKFEGLYKYQEYLKQANTLETPLKVGSEDKLDEVSNPILKHGITSLESLNIREKIKDDLEAIYIAAANGKWTDVQMTLLGRTECGVSNYISKEYLLTKIEENEFSSALSLCFEAINLGIMNSVDKNPLCAHIFVQTHSELINSLLISNPEYFVDGHILQASLMNASDYSVGLLGYEIEANTTHNKYLESVLTPLVQERLNDSVYMPLKKLIESGTWGPEQTNEMLWLISDKNIIGEGYSGYIRSSSNLGLNLKMVDDILNIVKVIAFKTINDALGGSTNFAPISDFTSENKELVIRIINDHPDHFTNNSAAKVAKNALEFTDLFASVACFGDISQSLLDAQANIDLTGENDT